MPNDFFGSFSRGFLYKNNDDINDIIWIILIISYNISNNLHWSNKRSYNICVFHLSWSIKVVGSYKLLYIFWLVVSNIFYFPCHIWVVILPIDDLIFFKMVIAPPTSIWCYERTWGCRQVANIAEDLVRPGQCLMMVGSVAATSEQGDWREGKHKIYKQPQGDVTLW